LKKVLLIIIVIFLTGQTIMAQEFTRIEDEAGIDHRHLDEYIMGGGAAFFDSNNDGYIDIYITGGEERDKLYINNQNNTYTDVADSVGFLITAGVKTNGVCTGDIDNDGDRDVFVTTGDGYGNLLFENQGDGTYLDISTDAGVAGNNVWSTSVTMGDYNNDGYLDIYVGNYVTITGLPNIPFYEQLEEEIPNYFYVNNGDNTFTESAFSLGIDFSGATLAVAFTDFDKDNDVDIYVANDFGGLFGANTLFRNDYPSNTFTDVSVATNTNASINAMGIAIGDYDEDLNLDYYISNMSNNVFYKNDGDNTYTNIAGSTETGCSEGVSWGNFFFDYNNDTYPDLYVANGGVLMQDINRNQTNALFTLDSDLDFSQNNYYSNLEDSAITRGSIFGDIDNDGDLDILDVNINDTLSDFNAHLLENNLADSSAWLKIEVQGSTNNYDGYGTYIVVFDGGRTYIREIDGGSSYQSQNSSIAHFGLDDALVADSIIITWLGGDQQKLYDVASYQSIHIIEGVDYDFSTNPLCVGDSLLINNSWVSEAGTYSDTTYLGEDISEISIATVRLYNATENDVEVTINSGDSIFLSGEYQTTEGVYTDVYTTVFGCDSTVNTTLTIDFTNSINEIQGSDFNIYPNPSNGLFTLQLQESTFIENIAIYSILGSQVRSINIAEKVEKVSFDLLDETEGIYFIHINTGDRTFTKKVILNN
jgi:hypothetical protein